MSIQRLLLFLLCGFFSLSAFGGSFSKQYYTTKNGIPSNEVYSVIQDSTGFIWISTDRGIARYDGHEFKLYGAKYGFKSLVNFKLVALPNNGIAFYGSDHSVGILRNDSVNYIQSRENLEISTLLVHKSELLVIYRPQAIYDVFNSYGKFLKSDSSEFPLHVQLYDNSLSMHLGDATKTHLITFNFNNGSIHTVELTDERHKNIGTLKHKNQIIIATGNEILIASKDGSISRIQLPSTATSCIQIIKNELWVGLFNRGVAVIDLENQKIVECYLKGKTVTSLCMDRNGNTWASTIAHGLVKMSPTNYNHISEDPIRHFSENKKELIYSTADLQLKKFDKHSKATSLLHNSIKTRTIVKDKDGFAVVGYGKQVNNSVLDNIQLFRSSSHCTYWNEKMIGVFYNKLYEMGMAGKQELITDELSSSYTYCIGEYANGLFIGRSLGLYKIVEDNGAYIEHKLLATPTTCFSFSEKGRWIGTKGFGLYALDENFKRVQHISTDDHLSGSFISALLQFGDTLFVGTENGVDMVLNSNNKNELKIFNSSISEGLYATSTTGLSRQGNTLYVSTTGGLQSIGIKSFATTKTNPIPLFVSVNGLEILSKKKQTIAAGTTSIRLGINSILLQDNVNYRLEYRVASEDSTWITTTAKELEFLNLSPGEYTVQLRTKLPTNEQYQYANFTFDLKPLFVQTLGFKVLVLVGISLAMLALFLLRIQRIQRKNYYLLEQEKLRFKALTAQLNPHFMFNALSNIQNLIITNENDIAAEYLSRFSDLVAKTLDNTHHLFIALYDEMDFINQYIEIEKSRFEKAFDFEWVIEPQLDINKLLVPTMFLQPYIENSILHGINRLDKNGKITVSIHQINTAKICVEIVDNGIGLTASKKVTRNRSRKSLAMDNLNKRISIMTKLYKSTFTHKAMELLNENNECIGTKISIVVPFKLKQ